MKSSLSSSETGEALSSGIHDTDEMIAGNSPIQNRTLSASVDRANQAIGDVSVPLPSDHTSKQHSSEHDKQNINDVKDSFLDVKRMMALEDRCVELQNENQDLNQTLEIVMSK